MTIFKKLTALAVVSVLPLAANAEPRIYPYAAAANYCPAGQQPVSIDGVICCGVPNQGITYQQAMSHPVTKKRKMTHRVSTPSYKGSNCPEGQKGCIFN